MTQRQEIIERLNGLELEGGSHEMLSAICKAVLPHGDAWTLRRCADLRDRLVRLLGEAERNENGFVRLPKDADGEYIHIGDVMEWCDSGETLEVIGIGVDDTLFYFDKGSDGEEMADWTSARNKRHHTTPTVEDVLRELFVYAERGKEHHREDVDDAVLAEYAAKLLLAGSDAE